MELINTASIDESVKNYNPVEHILKHRNSILHITTEYAGYLRMVNDNSRYNGNNPNAEKVKAISYSIIARIYPHRFILQHEGFRKLPDEISQKHAISFCNSVDIANDILKNFDNDLMTIAIDEIITHFESLYDHLKKLKTN